MKKQNRTPVIYTTVSYGYDSLSKVQSKRTCSLIFPEIKRGIEAIHNSTSYFGGSVDSYAFVKLFTPDHPVQIQGIKAPKTNSWGWIPGEVKEGGSSRYEEATVPRDVLEVVSSDSFREYVEHGGDLVYRILTYKNKTLLQRTRLLVKLSKIVEERATTS